MNWENYLGIIACPETNADITIQGKDLVSTKTGQVYPQTQGIPWLYKDPQLNIQEWRSRYELQMAHLQRDSTSVLNELRRDDLLPTTQRRLRKYQQSLAEHAKAIAKLLQPLAAKIDTNLSAHQAFKTQLPETQTLMSYYDNIFRDWCWGENENRISAKLVGEHMPADCETMLVLGAGGCRLAVDLHNHHAVKRTLAIDINPFLFLAARRILQGKKLHLYEFPIAPIDGDSFAIKQTLQWDGSMQGEFAMAFSDAMFPPIKSESVDCVITPWFIDIIPQDTKDFLPTINRILKPGGRWINFGSLVYRRNMQSSCYSREEVLQLVEAAGFTVNHRVDKEIPYLQSPASCQKRFENVMTWSATKTTTITANVKPYSYLPDYITNPDMPVPRLQAFVDLALANGILSEVMALFDGSRTQRDIANFVAQKIQVDAEQARAMVYNMLVRTYQEQITGKQF